MFKNCTRLSLLNVYKTQNHSCSLYLRSGSSINNYATVSGSSHDDTLNSANDNVIFNWPTIQYPTPYEIFHIAKAGIIDKKTLKHSFHQLAKVYHPDSLSNSSSHTETHLVKLSKLTPEVKEERFKLIVAAYNILKDDSKRRDFDLYNKGWETGSRAGTYYGRDFSRATKFKTKCTDEDDPWASYHNDYRERMRQEDPEYQRQQWEKHKRMVYILAAGSMAIGVLQFTWLSYRAESDAATRHVISQKAHQHIYLASTNYGYGYGKQDRISRFLAHREDGLYNDMDEKGAQIQMKNPLSLSSIIKPKSDLNENERQSLDEKEPVLGVVDTTIVGNDVVDHVADMPDIKDL